MTAYARDRRRPHGPHRHLTPEERQFIVDTNGTHTAVEQAKALNMDYDCLCFQRQQLIRAGLIDPATRKYARPYTAEEDARIVELAQAGYSIPRIARALNRPYQSVIHEIAKLGGIRKLRGEETSRVRTPSEVGALFGLTKSVIMKWLKRGWLASSTNAKSTRRRRTQKLITDEAIQIFMANRDYWPGWSPATITDPDWAAYAREVRARAGGEWLPIQAVAHRSGIRVTRLYKWVREGRLRDLTILTYGVEYLVWSTDEAELVRRIRAHRNGGHNKRRT